MNLDSLFLCLTKPIEELAKPGHEAIWQKIYPSIFCTDENDPDLKRQPGLLKVIFLSLVINILNALFRPNSRRKTEAQ